MKIKIVVREDLCARGDMYVIDNTRTASIRYDIGRYLEEGEPMRIVICHPGDQKELEEMIEENDTYELVD